MQTNIINDNSNENQQIDDRIRACHALFLKDKQPVHLQQLRQLALRTMEELEQFNPYLTGAVLNGTVSEDSDIYIQLYVDNNKDVVIFLLNKHIQFEVSETPNKRAPRQQSQETLSFIRENEGIHLILFAVDDLRQNTSKKTPRANLQTLRKLLQESET